MSKLSKMKVRSHWINIAFITLTPLAALVLVPIYYSNYEFSWGPLVFLLVTFSLTNLAITSGYHRYFSHRSFQMQRWLEWIYVLFGAAAVQGSILQWCTDHRRHHLAVDTDRDPYSINKGFWYAHMGWLFEDSPKEEAFAPDLMRDPLLRWQHRNYGWIATLTGFALPTVIGYALGWGWGGFLFGGLLRVVISHHTTFFVNSLAHYLGNRPYSDRHSARDNWLVAVLTFGEGYHNFHHEFQIDYRNGIKWYQWDPTKWWIRIMYELGWAQKLKRVAPQEILKARLFMDEKRMLLKGASSEKLADLRQQILLAQARWRQLKDEMRLIRDNFGENSRRKLEYLRLEMKLAKMEFRFAYSQWMAYSRSY